MERWATFDCYGTLVDWDAGIGRELARIFGSERADELLRRYHELEPAIQKAEPTLAYREVMAQALEQLGAPGEEREALAWSLPSWPVFPEVPSALAQLRTRGVRLCILSNTDLDLLQASMAAIGVCFDRWIVASQIGSYKPAPGHWQAFRDEVGRLPDVHVAASLFHDIVPAMGLGIPCIWIDRLGEDPGELSPARTLPDLRGLADAVCELLQGRAHE
ncbi:MAG: HAD family hydrolase [Thermoleophilia bacterium]